MLSITFLIVYYSFVENWKCSRINQKGAIVIYDSVFLEGASHLEMKSFMTFHAFKDSDGTSSFVCFLYVPWDELNQLVENFIL